METILEYLFLLCLCASAGWLLEVVYRGIRHRKVVNPGFLTGCCLPIYGVGGAALYFFSGLQLHFLPNEFCRVAVILLLAAVFMTLVELAGGLISVKYFRVRLWDYSGEWMNFKGVICPKFSLIWGVIGAAYYFLLYPPLHRIASRTVEYPWMILGVGVYIGVFAVDLGHSLNVMQRLRKYAGELRTRINIDQIKANAKEHFRRETGSRHAPFNFYKMVGKYLNELQDLRGQIEEKWGKKK